MSSPQDLLYQVLLQAPSSQNLQQIKNAIQGAIPEARLSVKADRNAFRGIDEDIRNLNKSTVRASGNIEEMGRVIGTAARRFGAISVATGTFVGLARAIKTSIGEALIFERELAKIAQATETTTGNTKALGNEVLRISQQYGTASAELVKFGRIFAQAGFTAKQTTKSLELLAKTNLVGTFGKMEDTAEGIVAVLQQFGRESKRAGEEIQFLEKTFDSINRVAKKFAVESEDIVEAIRKTGGVFESAGGQVNELIALITAVRSTTRESAETIANGFKTIFTRIQRKDTIEELKSLGIVLEDLEGRFVGPARAIELLSSKLNTLDKGSLQFANIVEKVGGVYQIGRLITAIRQVGVVQEAYNEAQNASGDINKDVAIQQKTLINQYEILQQRFNAFVNSLSQTESFQRTAKFLLDVGNALLNIGDAIKPLLPLVEGLIALVGTRLLATGLKSLSGIGRTVNQAQKSIGADGPVLNMGFSGANRSFMTGGHVTGGKSSRKDSIQANLAENEYVLRSKAVKKLGIDSLNKLNTGSYDLIDVALAKKASFSNTGSVPAAYTGRVSDVLAKTGLNSLSALYDLVNPTDTFVAPSINRVPLRYPNGKKVALKEVRDYTSNISSQALAEFKKSGPDAANSYLQRTLGSVPTTVNNKTFAESGRTFQFVTSVQGAIGEMMLRAMDPTFQKLPNAYGIDMVSPDGRFAEAKVTGTRQSPITMIGKALIAIAKLFNPLTGFKNKKADNIAIPETTFYDTVQRFQSGGIVGGSGSGDKIPALLEPGETVINKRASRQVGYDVLNAMNRGSINQLAGGYVPSGKSKVQLSYENMSVDQLKSAEDQIRAQKTYMLLMSQTTKDIGEIAKKTEELFGSVLPKALSQFKQTAVAQGKESFVAGGANIRGSAQAQPSGPKGTLTRANSDDVVRAAAGLPSRKKKAAEGSDPVAEAKAKLVEQYAKQVEETGRLTYDYGKDSNNQRTTPIAGGRGLGAFMKPRASSAAVAASDIDFSQPITKAIQSSGLIQPTFNRRGLPQPSNSFSGDTFKPNNGAKNISSDMQDLIDAQMSPALKSFIDSSASAAADQLSKVKPSVKLKRLPKPNPKFLQALDEQYTGPFVGPLPKVSGTRLNQTPRSSGYNEALASRPNFFDVATAQDDEARKKKARKLEENNFFDRATSQDQNARRNAKLNQTSQNALAQVFSSEKKFSNASDISFDPNVLAKRSAEDRKRFDEGLSGSYATSSFVGPPAPPRPPSGGFFSRFSKRPPGGGSKPPIGPTGPLGPSGPGGDGPDGENINSANKSFDALGSNISSVIGIMASMGLAFAQQRAQTKEDISFYQSLQSAVLAATISFGILQQSATIFKPLIEVGKKLKDFSILDAIKNRGKASVDGPKKGRFEGAGGGIALGAAAGIGIASLISEGLNQRATAANERADKQFKQFDEGGTGVANFIEILEARLEGASLNKASSSAFQVGAGGAVGGALIGAALGSFIPVLGTAIGAALGGVIGGTAGAFGGSDDTRLESASVKAIALSTSAQYTAAKSAYDLSKAMNAARLAATPEAVLAATRDFSNSVIGSTQQIEEAANRAQIVELQNIGKGGVFSSSSSDAILKKATEDTLAARESNRVRAEGARQFKREAITGRAQEIFSKAKDSTDLLKISDLNADIEQFGNLTRAATAGDASQKNKAAEEAVKALTDSLVESQRVRGEELTRIEDSVQARTNEITSMKQLNDTLRNISKASANIDDAQQAIDIFTNQSSGGVKAGTFASARFSGDRLTEQANSVDVSPNKGIASRFLGLTKAADNIKEQAISNNVLNGLKNIKEGGVGERKDSIRKALTSSGVDFAGVDPKLVDDAVNALFEDLRTSKPSLEQIDKVADIFSGAAKKYASVLDTLTEEQTRYISVVVKGQEMLISAQQAEAASQERVRNVRDKGISRLTAVNEGRLSNQDRIGLADAREAGAAGDIAARFNLDPNASRADQLRNKVLGAQARIADNKKALNNRSLGLEDRTKLTTENVRLGETVNQLRSSMEKLSDQSDRAAEKMDAISRVRAIADAKAKEVSSFIGGSDEERMRQLEVGGATQMALQQGTFQMIPEDLRKEALSRSEELAKLDPGSAFAKSVGDAKVNDARYFAAQFGQQLSPDMEKAIRGEATSPEQKLIEELKAINTEEMLMSQALRDADAQNTQALIELTTVLNKINPATMFTTPESNILGGGPNGPQLQGFGNAQGLIPGQSAGGNSGVIQSVDTIVASLNNVAASFSNINMTHSLVVEGQLNLGGLDSEALATQIRDALGEYIGTRINEELTKRNNAFRTA